MPDLRRRPRTPILRWRWRVLSPGTVYHAVRPVTLPDGTEDWWPACELVGQAESVLEVDHTERCLGCWRHLALGLD
jgi:hypothetical protein